MIKSETDREGNRELEMETATETERQGQRKQERPSKTEKEKKKAATWSLFFVFKPTTVTDKLCYSVEVT